MRVTIVQGLEQAYYNLVHMIAEFLPRFVVMVVIILVGLLAAYLLGHMLTGGVAADEIGSRFGGCRGFSRIANGGPAIYDGTA